MTITHRPAGSGHPYAATADQLVPDLPRVGRPLTLGATGTGETPLHCEVVWADGRRERLAMTRLPQVAREATGGGHLDAAQAAAGDRAGWVAVIDVVPDQLGRYRFGDDTGVTDWFDLHPAQWTSDPRGHVTGAAARLVPGSVEWLVSAAGVHLARFALRLRPGDHVVGFGERFDALDQAGRSLDAVVFEQYKDQAAHGRTYLPMPFAHVLNDDGSGWGFHVRTARRTWFDVGATDPERLVVEVDLGVEPVPEPPVAVSVFDGSPTEVLTGFLDEVGRASELPAWVLRLWASGNEWNTQDAVLAQARRHRAEGIPIGAVVIEAWSDEEGFTVFRDAHYEPHLDGSPHAAADFAYPSGGAWPDPAGMIRSLHNEDVKVVLWQIPLQKTDPGLAAEPAADARLMASRGYAVVEADGRPYRNRGWWFPDALLPDFTDPEARAWWLGKRRYLVEELDVDGFKTDGGEHAWGRDLRYADGSRGDAGNNRYPVHYAQAYGDLLRAAGKSPVTFSRAGFTGSQAHGIVWAGDESSTWEAFRASLTAGLSAAACGIVYWGWDLAGFSGPLPSAELYLRAAAASAFLPIMQYHSEFNDHRRPLRDRTPWNVADQTGEPRVVPVFRSFVALRERLLPYLQDAARTAVTTDRPLLRPLFFDVPGEPELWRHPLQFGLGDALLVNPVTQPGAERWTTWLPSGPWVDVWSGEVVEGGGCHDREVPWDVVPVYCRAAQWPAVCDAFTATA